MAVGFGATVGDAAGVTLGPVGSSCAGGGESLAVTIGAGVVSGVGVASIMSAGVGVGSGSCAFLRTLQDTIKMTVSTISAKPPMPAASSFVFLFMLYSFLKHKDIAAPTGAAIKSSLPLTRLLNRFHIFLAISLLL